MEPIRTPWTNCGHLSAEKVLGNLNMATMNQPGYAGPFIDGRVVLADPQSVYLSGAGWHVPFMIGTNSLDIGFGFARDKEELFAPFGADREKAIAAYDPTGKGDLRAVQYQVSMDRFMVEPARFVASHLRFGRLPGLRVQILLCRESPCAANGRERPMPPRYLLSSILCRRSMEADLAPEDEKIAQAMLSYWVCIRQDRRSEHGQHPGVAPILACNRHADGLHRKRSGSRKGSTESKARCYGCIRNKLSSCAAAKASGPPISRWIR